MTDDPIKQACDRMAERASLAAFKANGSGPSAKDEFFISSHAQKLVRPLIEALDALRCEVGGLAFKEHEIRDVIGHTNYNCLLLKIKQADDALAPYRSKPEVTK